MNKNIQKHPATNEAIKIKLYTKQRGKINWRGIDNKLIPKNKL